jgi:Tol biopolymer transport system component
VAVSALEGDSQDVWIHDLARSTRTRLTFGDLWMDAVGRSPAWLPSGDRVGFTTAPAHIAIKSADGTGEARTLTEGIRPAISRDGRYLVYILRDDAGWGDIWYLPLDGKGEPTPLFQSPVHEVGVAISPDARHLAYVSDESGRLEIYVTRFPSGEGKWQASVNGGGWQRWGRRGDKLFYEENNTLMELDVTTEPTLALGTPRPLFSADAIDVTLDRGYAVGPDDDRFLVVQELKAEGGVSGITVVENWFAEFESVPSR